MKAIKILIVLLAAASLLLVQCKKDEAEKEKAKITFNNTHDSPYAVRLNDIYYFTIVAYESQTAELDNGDYFYKIEQQSGYLIYPTVFTGIISVRDGVSKTYNF